MAVVISRSHFVHAMLTIAALLLAGVLLVQFYTNSTQSAFQTEVCMQYRSFYLLGVVLIFSILLSGWMSIFTYIKSQRQSLATIEKHHPYIPKNAHMLLTLALTVLFAPLFVHADEAWLTELDLIGSVTEQAEAPTMEQHAAPSEAKKNWNCEQIGQDAFTGDPQWRCRKD